MFAYSDESYVDHKGRIRWRCNDQLAEKLKQLYALLVIGNYEESHAARYPRLAHAISRHPESVLKMNRDDNLESLPGVSKVIAKIIRELLETGTCTKMTDGDEFFTPPPQSVLELTEIPRLGAKTAKLLYQDYGIDSLAALANAIEDGTVESIKGIGKAMLATMKKYIQANRDKLI